MILGVFNIDDASWFKFVFESYFLMFTQKDNLEWQYMVEYCFFLKLERWFSAEKKLETYATIQTY